MLLPPHNCLVSWALCCAVLSHSFVSHSTTILTVAYPLSIGILQARILDWVAMASSRGSSQGWDPGLLNCRWIFYCMSQHTGVGSLSLLQGLFPTQELNWGLLLCRQIFYQLSYQGSPFRSSSGAVHEPLHELVSSVAQSCHKIYILSKSYWLLCIRSLLYRVK